MPNGTDSLSKNHLERGMYLVCVRDSETNEPLFHTINVPDSNITYTRTVNHDGDICTEVPQGVKTVSVLVSHTETQKGLQYANIEGVDENGIIYLYAQPLPSTD
ncbi:hypothetical protein JW899_03310 [Candidatus Uhrbacteria bacterium]|nr:hypothetical protein [Candidatus Uhrbacteria bacterium]